MPATTPALTRTSTDTLVAVLGDLRHSLGQALRDSAHGGVIPHGDTLLARVDGKAWTQSKGDYVFDLPNRSHGQVHQFFPGDKSSRITSIRVYARTNPPSREPDAAALEQQTGSDESQAGGGNGGGDGSGGGQNAGNDGVTGVAQGVKGDGEEEF